MLVTGCGEILEWRAEQAVDGACYAAEGCAHGGDGSGACGTDVGSSTRSPTDSPAVLAAEVRESCFPSPWMNNAGEELLQGIIGRIELEKL